MAVAPTRRGLLGPMEPKSSPEFKQHQCLSACGALGQSNFGAGGLASAGTQAQTGVGPKGFEILNCHEISAKNLVADS